MTLIAIEAQPDTHLTPAIGYIRVSTAREEMISPELQKKAILAWAERTNHRIVLPWIEDLDKTGRNFKRRIMDAIERVESGDVRVIAVWKYSRFGRSRTGVPANLARVEKAGGQLLSATEEVDARTAIGRFQRGMIMEFNAFESDRAGEQWTETHQWRRDNGLPSSGRKRFGYIWHPRKIHHPDGSIELQEERYEVDPQQRDAVIDCYTQYVAGTSFYSIAIKLNNDGYRTVRGGLWGPTAVRRYMDSGFAAGYLRFHKDTCPKKTFPHDCDNYELFRHPEKGHPAVISEKLWAEYQERREFTKKAPPRSRNAMYPLTSLCRCKFCGSASARQVNKNKDPRYVCMRRQDRGALGCVGSGTTATIIMTKVKAFLEEIVAEIEVSADGAVIPAPRTAETRESRLVALEGKLTKLDAAIARHMRVYALADDEDGTLEASYLSTLKELRASRSDLMKERAALEGDGGGVTPEGKRESLVPVALGLLTEWDTLEPGAINVLLRRIIARVEVGKKEDVTVVPVWDVA